MTSRLRLAPLLTLGLAVIAVARPAQAAAPWIYRSITLPRGEVSLDLGVGLGREPDGPDSNRTGLGMNLEVAAGVTHELELGFRTGFRFDADGRFTEADRYGRAFDTETYDAGNDSVANPELHLRWAVARGSAAQLGLEARAILPFAAGTRFGLVFALPISLRAGLVRIDTGLYVPVIFTDPTTTVISVPIHLWIQATSSFWLGPIFGIKVINESGGTRDEYPLGFGFGTMLRHNVDLRAWFLFPHINGDAAARSWGGGLAFQFRF
jgi:hypothetical protein